MSNLTLKEYVVSLHEDKGDKFRLQFECWADDAEHAADQASAAYPNGEVLTVRLKDGLDACCPNENRSMDGGCLSCGDPSL